MHQEARALRLVCGPNVAKLQCETLGAWEDILKINYWPIFAIAKDILEQLPGDVATRVLQELLKSAHEVLVTGVDNAHDLTGRIFQRLIADRKYLATFYTLCAPTPLQPKSAAAHAFLRLALLFSCARSGPPPTISNLLGAVSGGRRIYPMGNRGQPWLYTPALGGARQFRRSL